LNPATGVWQASLTVPTAPERFGDFSGFLSAAGQFLIVRDFTNNNNPFAGNIVPPSRLDLVATQAISAIPLPNVSGGAPNAIFTAQGSIPASGHFVVDSSNLSNVSNFGGYNNVAVPGASGIGSRRNACSLTVDGVLVSSTLTTFN
jgi:hypothetical protein